MKALPLALLALAFAIPLRADNWLENGDFMNGIDHWRGNGRSPADFASDSPFDKPDPFTSKGLIIDLKQSHWAKVLQDFHGKGSSGVLTITYMVSPDLTFSNKGEYYQNVPGQIEYDAWVPFNMPPGDWVVLISDFGAVHGPYYEIKPKLGSSNPQIFQTKVDRLTPNGDKTITLAFPPGSGKLVILSVSLTDQ
ncbi:MAG TPA: hypothetical protein VGZ93_01955 [Candidatus Methylacidiphilales bacterium]|nr:hypothetical protein [Candidatus Methylacidiphilales bacterium]